MLVGFVAYPLCISPRLALPRTMPFALRYWSTKGALNGGKKSVQHRESLCRDATLCHAAQNLYQSATSSLANSQGECHLPVQEWQLSLGTCKKETCKDEHSSVCTVYSKHSQAGSHCCRHAVGTHTLSTHPRTSMASLTANGKPHKGLMLDPFAALASIAAASCRACEHHRTCTQNGH